VKIIAVIPAHLASVRFPRKILHKIHGLPMIEHVRRRALLSQKISDVFVATCDEEIADLVSKNGGNVIMTAKSHKNGTTRVSEAVHNIDCSHVLLLQGDEPLLLPSDIDLVAQEIINSPDIDSWNATGPIDDPAELDRHSFVKCAVSHLNYIMLCFRRSPCYSDLTHQQVFIRKILGIIAYRKEFLIKIAALDESALEKAEFIEQMRIIENNYKLKSVPFNSSLPSVNEPNEVNVVLDFIKKSSSQQIILSKTLNS